MPLSIWGVEFKVASYNVENLFDEIKNGSEYDVYTPGKHNWSSHTVDIKLNNISEVLCELNADIVALQEIENRYILKRLQKRLKRVGCPYKYSAITSPKKTSAITVGLLSKYPLSKQKELKVSYSPRDRNILEVVASIGGKEITIFVNHWKSKYNIGKESRRVRYAKVLMKRISSLQSDREYIILGDLNSNYDEFRVMDDKLNDTKGVTGINHIMKTIKNGRMIEKNDILRGDTIAHYNLWLEYPPSQRWSYNFYGRKGAIDHILLPYTLFDGKEIEYINHSFGVFKPRFLFTKKGWIHSWEYKNGKHLGRGYSDHLPIYARFDIKPFVSDERREHLVSDIESLYSVDTLARPVILEGCSLIFKRGNNGIIKQSANKMAIYLYGTARGLVEGKRYNLIISEIKNYQGLKEITNIKQATEVHGVNMEGYYLTQNELDYTNPKSQNQIFRHIRGMYRDGYLFVDNRKIPIYFKKKRIKPKNGAKLNIDYAHLGYYHKAQLVIYDQADFSEEE